MASPKTPAAAIREFFGMDLKTMKAEWMGKDDGYAGAKLTTQDKEELGAGLMAYYGLDEADQAKVLSESLSDEHKANKVLTY